jgi:DNA repair protein RecO (recombination protein O)
MPFRTKINQKIAYSTFNDPRNRGRHHKNKGTLENFKEIKISTPFQTIHTDIYKSTIVMFVSEVLHHSIHEENNESLLTF